jgi:hypothetical protein
MYRIDGKFIQIDRKKLIESFSEGYDGTTPTPTTAPTIALNAPTETTVTKDVTFAEGLITLHKMDVTFTDPRATAQDAAGGTLEVTEVIYKIDDAADTVVSAIDTDSATASIGDRYRITYSATDSYGNTATVDRIVVVTDGTKYFD